MDMNTLREMIEQDSVIDETELDRESTRLPQLHGKYLNFYHDEKLRLENLRMEYSILYRRKWEYYTGKMDEDQLKHYGWEPFDLKVLKQDLHIYTDSDEDLIAKRKAIIYQESKVSMLEAVVKEITFRHNKIRNAIDWKRFLAGN